MESAMPAFVDISREEFLGDFEVQGIQRGSSFDGWGTNLKHNCLWDAWICRQCFRKIPCVNNIRD